MTLLYPAASKRLSSSVTINSVDMMLEAVNGSLFQVHGIFRAPVYISDDLNPTVEEFLVAEVDNSHDCAGILGYGCSGQAGGSDRHFWVKDPVDGQLVTYREG